ncbi:OmpA family protein [Flavobacterium sp.]|uniref:OmpA family protein n=1 Tax=Flavobacterium sp. TaxID=239 RepID=UPI0035285E1C
MKKIYLTLSFVIASSLLSAQNKETKTADKLFDRYEYVDAAKEYLKLVNNGKSNVYVESQLADSYYYIFNTKEAAQWYAKVADQKNDAETYYRYAQMLKANGNYSEADKQMAKFAALKPNDQRAKDFKNNPNYLSDLKAQAKLFDVSNADLNSENSDFGAILTNDNEVYFVSSRNESRKKYGWNDEPYLDIYKAIYNQDGTFSESSLVDGLNTKWNEGPVAFSPDGNTIYYSSESFNDGEFVKDKQKKLKYGQMFLYKAVRDGNTFTDIKALPFNNKEYSMRNPAVSSDGKTLYFSSDMPGGLGGEDIWKVNINNGSYGTPENLGNTVNTAGNESFPYVSESNVLYFASDAREGFGGYDVFKTDLNKAQQAVNLGEPVNSEKDDFSFAYNETKKIAFFASNRSGNDNLYTAVPVCGVNGVVLVKNAETGAAIADAMVALVEADKVIANQNSKTDGKANFSLNCNKQYAVQASKKGFENGVATFSKTDGGTALIEVLLQPIKPIITDKEVILEPIFFEFDKSNITAQGAEELDKLVQVMNENPTMVIFAKSHTDNRGSDKYNMNLSDRRAKATVQYIISKGIDKERISGQGFGETEPKVDCKKDCTEEQHALNRRSEFLIVKK